MNPSWKIIIQHQIWQLFSAVILILIVYYSTQIDNKILTGSLWNISTNRWLWITISIPVLHQFYVFLVWRLELYKNTFTNIFGTQLAFKIYKIGFSILFISRLLFIIILSFSNSNTLDLNVSAGYLLTLLILPFVIYLFYSVKKYFTIDRAFGIDHFEKNFKLPFVKKGIFKYTENGMYIYGFLILYIPGLLLLSKAALLVAIFNHIFIWAHYYFTERPDMKKIYGN